MEKELFESLANELRTAKNGDLLRQIKDLVIIGNVRLKEIIAEEVERARLENLRVLKNLKPRTKVYTRLTGILFGKELLKIKDGKDYMQVAGDGKAWRVPYSSLQTEPLNSMELQLGKIISSIP